jgi:hypothetical protein
MDTNKRTARPISPISADIELRCESLLAGFSGQNIRFSNRPLFAPVPFPDRPRSQFYLRIFHEEADINSCKTEAACFFKAASVVVLDTKAS